jgi:hypothetical protein
MSATVGYATLQIIPSAKGMLGNLNKEFGGSLDQAGADAGDSAAKAVGRSYSSGMKSVVKAGALAFGAAAVGAFALGKASIDAASNLDESMSKIDVVFGSAAGSVKDWAADASTAFGQSQQQALEAAGTYGNLLQAFGIGGDAAQTMSQDFVQLASDLASFNNTSVDEALQALQSGLSGETEPLKKYGVALSDVRLKQEALALGLISSTSDALTPAAKAQASYSLIMKDTTLAQGDFARTSDGLANKQRIMAARFEDVKASIGKALIPAMAAAVGFITDKIIPAISKLAEEWMPKLQAAFETVSASIQTVASALATAFSWLIDNQPVLVALGVFVGTVLVGAFVAWATATWAQVAAWWALNAAQVIAMAQFILIAAAIAAVAAGLVWAYQNVDWFREAVDKVAKFMTDTLWPALQSIAVVIVDVVVVAFEAIVTAAGAVVTAVSWLWDNVLSPYVTFLKLEFAVAMAAAKLAFDVISTAAGGVTTAIGWLWDNILSPYVSFLKLEFAVGMAIASAAFDAVVLAVGYLITAANWLCNNVLAPLVEWIGAGFSTGMAVASAVFGSIGTAIDGLITFVETLVGVLQTVIDTAKSAIEWVGKIPTLNDLPGRGQSVFDIIGFEPPAGASGFRNFAGGLALVGEQGPELAMLPRGTGLMTNRATRQMLDGAAAATATAPAAGITIGEVHNHNDVDADGFWRGARMAVAGSAA